MQETPDVTIVGAGIAGLTAALRLLQRGFSVRVLEQNDFVGGKWGAHRSANGDWHEHCYHMVLTWYHNLWGVVDEIGARGAFRPQHEMRYLRAGAYPASQELRDVGAVDTALSNLASGVMSLPDMAVYSQSLLDLLGQPMANDFLDQYAVNAFMRGRPYMTEEAARMHHRTLAKAFAAPSYATAASTYRNFIRYGFRAPSPMMWMLDGPAQERVFGPLVAKLNSFGPRFELRTLSVVTKLELEAGRVARLQVARASASPSVAGSEPGARGRPVLSEAEPLEVDELILAVPPGALRGLVDDDVYAAAPELAGVFKLRSEPMASIDLHFRRRLPDVPQGIVVMVDARYDLTFVDNSQIWPGYPNTYLNVVASDFDELAELTPLDRDGEGTPRVSLDAPRTAVDYALRELRRYVPFAAEDVDLARLYVQTNVGEELIVNDVGSWRFRPGPTCGLPNLRLAGDFCRTHVDAVTLEGATTSGLRAAESLRAAKGRGAPIPILEPQAYPEGLMRALAVLGAPTAYMAKAASVAGDEAWRAYRSVFAD